MKNLVLEVGKKCTDLMLPALKHSPDDVIASCEKSLADLNLNCRVIGMQALSDENQTAAVRTARCDEVRIEAVNKLMRFITDDRDDVVIRLHRSAKHYARIVFPTVLTAGAMGR